MDLQTRRREFTLGFIGAGKLAGSIMRGLLRSGYCSPNDIIASEPGAEARAALSGETKILAIDDNAGAARTAAMLFLAVKPGMVLPVAHGIASEIQDKLVISLAAGVRLKDMEAIAPARFLRAMTNTPTAICRGATSLARGTRTTPEDFDRAQKLFSAIGVTVEIQEEQIDAVTALAGSGPAFVYSVIEALVEGGQRVGLEHEIALTLATQTVLGAAQLAAESKMSPEELRRMVVTPGGTTAAGLAAMEKLQAGEALAAAVQAATKRGREMAAEFGETTIR